jgi:hypothetical protein
MPKQTSDFKPTGLRIAHRKFVSTDSAVQDVIAADADDSIISHFVVTSKDAASNIFEIIINNGALDHIVGALTIPAGAGTDGIVPAVDVLSMNWVRGSLPLAAGSKIRVRPTVPVGGNIVFTAIASDY